MRLKATTCLYISLNSKARSLSTLIAVIVIKDTEHKIQLVKYHAENVYRQILHFSRSEDIQWVALRGWIKNWLTDRLLLDNDRTVWKVDAGKIPYVG